MMRNVLTWALSIFVAFIFVQSMFFKFSGATETVIIFSTLADWMISIGLPEGISNLFGKFGAYAVGGAELVAAVLVLLPRTRIAGAILSLLVISGAILAHLCTPLGIDRVVDYAGQTDGGALFYTACAVWLSSALIVVSSTFASNTLATKSEAQHELQTTSAA